MTVLDRLDDVDEAARTAHLDDLVDEAITIVREVTAECEQPVLLFSGGKDSAVLLQLAVMAFAPARLPFPVLHVDTGHNFPEVLAYRDRFAADRNAEVLVAPGAGLDRSRSGRRGDRPARPAATGCSP